MTSIPEISTADRCYCKLSFRYQPPIRLGGREMSAPRPCETYLFHPPALFTPHIWINFYIYSKLSSFFLSSGIYIVSWSICYLRMRPSRTTYFEVQCHFEVILSSLWYVLFRNTVTVRSLRKNFFEFTKGNGAKHTLIAPCRPRSNCHVFVLNYERCELVQFGVEAREDLTITSVH